MDAGQELALRQLRHIEAAKPGALEIVNVQERGALVVLEVSIHCGAYERRPDGLQYRRRERFHIFVFPDFPFDEPWIEVSHTRFSGHPHVQWGKHLCLYQAPDTEWNPTDGMYGFITRLDEWLRQAALNALDPIGAPLHPPVAYVSSSKSPLVVPRADTPVVGPSPWIGFASLKRPTEHFFEITDWLQLGKEVPGLVAAAALLSEPMPFEYPDTVAELIQALASRGVSQQLVLLALQVALLHNSQDDPLFLVVGAPMRGIRGSGALKQHLAIWSVNAVMTQGLRLTLEQFSPNPQLRDIGAKAEKIILDWARTAKVVWCDVREDRPEIVVRRDEGSAMAQFRGRAVSLWGCGALGSHIAEFLVRAGVSKLSLYDKGRVTPGLLVRQAYDFSDIGRPKVEALSDRLHRIRPDVQIEAHSGDILRQVLGTPDWCGDADLVIDTTAANAIAHKFELVRKDSDSRTVPVASIVIGHQADSGFAVIVGREWPGGIFDAVRRSKIAVCNRPELEHFANEFWPRPPRRNTFQPEPGCSDPTFIGSDAGIASLAGQLLSLVAKALDDIQESQASVHFLAAADAPAKVKYKAFTFEPAVVCEDPHSQYQVRIAASCNSEFKAWTARTARTKASNVETGGVLFGERDDVSRIIWVDEVSGPPPDSEESPEHFLCGIAGVKESHEEKGNRTRGSVKYVGTWHSHPESLPVPSFTDLDGIRRLSTGLGTGMLRAPLLLIITPTFEHLVVGAYVFQNEELTSTSPAESSRECAVYLTGSNVPEKTIGLALSGGGSRAIAFHLGCLRALHDRGILPQVEVLSAVSGGSVIGAMYAYTSDDFENFDRRVRELLRKGLSSAIVKKAIRPRTLATTALTMSTAGLLACGYSLARTLVELVIRVLGISPSGRLRTADFLQTPWRRWSSLTTAFEAALDDLFSRAKLTGPRRNDMHVVLNACELRTGTAFRFGSKETGCWRIGRLKDNSIKVAHAVAASAAYPVFLPAVDRRFRFITRNDVQEQRRVILTDGGVYDNLGTSCIEPDRSESHSYNVFRPKYIIACDAGPGLPSEHEVPYLWPSRVRRAFEATHRRTSTAAYSRLHRYAEAGELEGFILVYLGQRDENLPYMPPDLVRREDVYAYPTDFDPMTDDVIDKLAARGETLARMLIARYTPEL